MDTITSVTKSENACKDMLLLVAQICRTKVTAISFFDTQTGLMLDDDGLSSSEFFNDDFFIAYYLDHPGILIIPNIGHSRLFDSYGIFNGESSNQFYAGVPLIDANGMLVGHLSVMDDAKRPLSQQQITTLKAFAGQFLTLHQLQQKVTALEKNEELSKNNETLMEAIFHNANDAVIVMDNKGVILQWNPKATVIFGWSGDEVIGKSFRRTVIAEESYTDYFKLLDHYKTRRQLQKNSQTIEICACRNDRSTFDISLGFSSTIIFGQRYYICSINDITDQKLITTKLDKQKEFYESILNKLPIDIAVFDANHRYIFVNPGAIRNEELRKYIIGKDDYEYAIYRNRDISIADIRRAQFLQAKSTGKEIRWEDSLPNPQGMMITHLRRMFPVHDENGELSMVIGFGLDITDRKVLEEKQATLVDNLSKQNTQLIDFCNIVSHNLRAPLVNMSMLVEFIEECTDVDEQKVFVSKFRPVLSNLHTTFNELVESIQIKNNLEIERENVDLFDSVQRTLNTLQAEIAQLDAKVEMDFSAASVVFYPPQYLHSIIHNLISNSLKYSSPDRKPLIKMATSLDKGNIIFSINDNGLGIDLIKHKDNFFKIGKVFHRHTNSKGFGLFMTKTQVEAMGGMIWVESAPGEGSTFYIEFKNQIACNEK
ncbi:MAG TPA: PAS domain S-box protein [Mucilaginibacter sp.]|jgi:PAS domain S-box-containing protein